jgi:transposase-like protein
MPRRYPPEFRRRVIDLIESGQSVAEVAEGLYESHGVVGFGSTAR